MFPNHPASFHANHDNQRVSDNMVSHSLPSPSRESSPPVDGLRDLSIGGDLTTPVAKLKKAHSETSLTTLTPPDSSRNITSAHGTSNLNVIAPDEPVFAATQADDDVFGETHSSCLSTPPPATATSTSTSNIAASKAAANAAIPLAHTHTPRADRMNTPITPANAQGVLPPEACVFVANLSMIRTDEQLEVSCHQAFDIFGPCVVKVRRDKRQHPFALVQFHTIEDANRAVEEAKDLVVDNRLIRTEHAQARRSVVLIKAAGGVPTTEDAETMLGMYGPIANAYLTTLDDQNQYGVPQGMWVEFAYYDDFKDAVRQFANTPSRFQIQVPRPKEPRTRSSPVGTPTYSNFRFARSSSDVKSIFVGNLPGDCTEQELYGIFVVFGEIRSVNVIHKLLHGGTGYNVFGFIEFANAKEAMNAAAQEFDIRGRRIRVEPKEYSARRHTRLSPYSPATPYNRGQNEFASFSQSTTSVPLNPAAPYFNMPYTPHQNQPVYHHEAPQYANASPQYNVHPAFNAYQTPPPTARIGRRYEYAYSGSPHSMTPWSPYAMASPAYGHMAPINESEFEEQNGY